MKLKALLFAATAVAGIAAIAFALDEQFREKILKLIGENDGDETAETVEKLDLDGDGNVDTVTLDTDGDGEADTVLMDSDGNGMIDTVLVDTDADGAPDTALDVEETEKI
jgi:hypothetical protein